MKRLLTRKETAEYLGISEKTLWEWVNDGLIPQVLFPTKKPKYDIKDLDALVNKNKRYISTNRPKLTH